jgi:ActR/RegA family two-component response regulator
MSWKVTLRLERTDPHPEENVEERGSNVLEHIWYDGPPAIRELMWAYAQRVFLIAGGDMGLAAKVLGIGRRRLKHWLKKGVNAIR